MSTLPPRLCLTPAALRSLCRVFLCLSLFSAATLLLSCAAVEKPTPSKASGSPNIEWIQCSEDASHFVLSESGRRFVIWGVNYDHDRDGRLLEDYWDTEWETAVEDFWEMKTLGANAVRIHLQLGKFMKSPDVVNRSALQQLSQLVRLAEETRLYLNITGLGCYHKQDIPEWYEALDEQERWRTQALFWEAVARTCAHSPAVFCYDLMNEPVVSGVGKAETDWLVGKPLGGKYFVQRIALDLAGRTREDVTCDWINTLVDAIRAHDTRHLITVGEIPWARVFPGAKSHFHSAGVGENLDFVSVHFYPRSGEVEKALKALDAYRLGKPVVVEEMFPLRCGLEELDLFVEGSRHWVAGYFGFYWGKSIEDYGEVPQTIGDAIVKKWLEYFRDKAKLLTGARPAEPESPTRPTAAD